MPAQTTKVGVMLCAITHTAHFVAAPLQDGCSNLALACSVAQLQRNVDVTMPNDRIIAA